MFDPNKYDNTANQANSNADSFQARRTKVIEGLQKIAPLILKECEMLEEYVKNNPNSKAADPFKEKLDGWSRILNGINIVKEKYKVK